MPGATTSARWPGCGRRWAGDSTGTVRDGAAPATPPTFAVDSPPLADVVRDINKFSNNVMAQQLFLTLGLTQRGIGTPEAARAVLRQWLADRFGAAADAAGDRQRLRAVARRPRSARNCWRGCCRPRGPGR